MTTFTVNATATAATTNRITINSAENMFSGLPIVFSGTAFGGITAGATYYVGTVTPGTPTSTITITSLPGGGVVTLSTATGTMTGTVTLGGQQIIPVVPPGQPLNQAFANVNLNFDQIFAAGPVLSNVQIVNNTILTTNTNGNLVLAPNGTGVVQSNVHIVPNTANIRNLGSANLRWNTIYTQYLNSNQINLANSLSISGTLAVNQITSDDSTFVTITDGLDVNGDINADSASVSNYFGLPVYANTTARDNAISSPQPGMMIYVTGTGMQVRGTTTWNTVAGTST